jgi:hypothetical protein
MVNASRPSAISCCLIAISCLAMLVCFGLVESPASASASEGPVAAYPLDAGEGTSAEDPAGNHEGTIEGATWTRGKYGQALSFDGKEDCLTVSDSPDLQLSEEFTLEAWVKPEGSLSSEPLIFKEAKGGPSYALGLGFSNAGKAEGYAEGESIASPEALEPNVWTHLAYTYDGARMRLYLNDELVTDKYVGSETFASAGPLQIGCAAAFNEYFKGKLDEPRIYDRALDGSEVAADKSAPIQTPSAGPVAAYPLDAGEGTTAEDPAGNHEGTIEGATWTRGKYGQALSFDGKEDCLTVSDSPDLQLSEEFTLEAWVKPEGSLSSEPLIFKEAKGGPSYALGLGFSNAGKAEGYAEGESIASPEALEPNVWTHLAYTYDGARMRLYLDGELVTNKYVGSETFASAGPLQIGCAAAFNEYFKGKLDEPRIYDRALGGGEVAADKAAPIQTPSAGPVAAYSFDEGEGTSAEDLTGNGHTATLEGATWARGRYGGGLQFDGKEDCVSIPNSPELQLTEEFTLEAWVRPTGSGEEAGPLLTQVDTSAGEEEERFAYELLAGENEVPKAWVRKGGEAGYQGIYGTEPLPEHAWAHLALSDDGAHLRLYVDGELVSTTPAPDVTVAAGPLEIGCDAFGGHFEGRIDELRLYNRVLDEAEVQGDKAAPIQTPSAGPVAAYSFDEGEGTSAEDLTGNGHTATLEGATWARGRYGDGLQFDGENDCVSIPNSPELQLTEEFTLEAWVRPTGSGEEAGPVLTQVDTSAGEEEERFAYELLAGENEVPKAWVRKGGEAGYQGIYGTEPLPEHAWAHLALTDDGAHLRLYVDGDLVRTTPAPNVTTASGSLEIGCDAFGGHFEGRIDELRIYNRVLDGGEVAADKSAPIQTPSAGPVAAYSFDEGEGETVEDLTGNGHAATIEGATWARGRYGDGLQFDGENDCVTVPESSELDFSEEFTLESWVKPEGELHHDPIVFKEGEGFPSYALGIGIPHSGKAEGVIGQEGKSHENVYSSESIEADVWTHLALTYDGAKLRLYVNGELVATEAVENADSGSPGPLTIGCDALYGANFKGKIDEVKIYNRALGVGELDFTPPSPPTEYEAMLEDDEGDAGVYWTPSVDRPSPTSGAATGVSYYRYRTNRTGSWGGWETTTVPFFEFEEAEEGAKFFVQAQAVDGAKNPSEITEGQVEVESSSLMPENVGEEARPGEWKSLEVAEEPAHPDIEGAEAERLKEEEESFAPQYTLGSNELCEGGSENPCGTYHPKKAAEYVYRWVREGNEEFWNHEFRFFGGRGGDCTNFTSQVLWAGGMNFARTHGYDEPDTEANGENHYGDYQWGQGSWWEGYFYFDGQLKEFKRPTESFVNAEKLRDHLVEYGLVDYVPKGDPVQRGDIIFYNEHGTASNKLSHSQTVVAVTPGKIWVGQHSEAYIKTLRAVRHHVDETRGPQGNAWEYWIYRPVHTRANLNLP